MGIPGWKAEVRIWTRQRSFWSSRSSRDGSWWRLSSWGIVRVRLVEVNFHSEQQKSKTDKGEDHTNRSWSLKVHSDLRLMVGSMTLDHKFFSGHLRFCRQIGNFYLCIDTVQLEHVLLCVLNWSYKRFSSKHYLCRKWILVVSGLFLQFMIR